MKLNEGNKIKHLQGLDCFKAIYSYLVMYALKSSPKRPKVSFFFTDKHPSISVHYHLLAWDLYPVLFQRKSLQDKTHTYWRETPTGQNDVHPRVINSHLHPAALFYLYNREHAALNITSKALHINNLLLRTENPLSCLL